MRLLILLILHEAWIFHRGPLLTLPGVWRTSPWLRPECNVNCDEYNKPWPRRQDQQDQTMSDGLRHAPARYRRAWSCWKDALGCQHGLFTLVSWAENSEGLQRQRLGDWWYAAFRPHMEPNAQDGAATFGSWTMTYGLTVWPEGVTSSSGSAMPSHRSGSPGMSLSVVCLCVCV